MRCLEHIGGRKYAFARSEIVLARSDVFVGVNSAVCEAVRAERGFVARAAEGEAALEVEESLTTARTGEGKDPLDDVVSVGAAATLALAQLLPLYFLLLQAELEVFFQS